MQLNKKEEFKADNELVDRVANRLRLFLRQKSGKGLTWTALGIAYKMERNLINSFVNGQQKKPSVELVLSIINYEGLDHRWIMGLIGTDEVPIYSKAFRDQLTNSMLVAEDGAMNEGNNTSDDGNNHDKSMTK
jgi:hypothetical protein